MGEPVAIDLEGAGRLVAELRSAAGAYEQMASQVRAALNDPELDDPVVARIFEVGSWCGQLSEELTRRIEAVQRLDASPLLGFLVSVDQAGVARGLLPGTELPNHLQAGGWPSSQAEWQALAFARAGIDPAGWDPQAGFEANRDTVAAVYDHYLELYRRDDRLQWTAMGRLAGAAVWAGLEDLVVLDGLPAYGQQGPWMERELLEMQKAIFEDLAWQHEAYLAGGVDALRAARDRGDIDRDTMEAWEHLDAGRVAAGTRLLVYREQRDVLQDDHYARWADHAPHLAAVTSATAVSPVPGGRPFWEVVAPQVTTVSDALRSPGVPIPPLRSPLPIDHTVPQLHDWDGARKVWIDDDMLAAHERFLAGDDADAVLSTPVEQRAQEFRNPGATSWQQADQVRRWRPPIVVPGLVPRGGR